MKALRWFRNWRENRRSALNTIAVCERMGIVPKTLVDIGANNSQWARYLVERWPMLDVLSFDPHRGARPIGRHYVIACSNVNEVSRFVDRGVRSHLSPSGSREVICARFDWICLDIKSPALLKVDCENTTFEALEGCGRRLLDFDLVHVEMVNRESAAEFINAQAKIWRLMLDAGFDRGECVQASVVQGGVNYMDMVFYRWGVKGN